jgi:hypothetical protein
MVEHDPAAQSEPRAEQTASAEDKPTKEQLRSEIEASADPVALMSAVANAEKTGVFHYDAAGLMKLGHEVAARLGDREVALMYGNRLVQVELEATVRRQEQITGAAAELEARMRTNLSNYEALNQQALRITEYRQ